MIKNLFLPLCLVCSVALSLSSQSIFYNYEHENFLRLELNRPVFTEDIGASLLSFDAFLNGEFSVGEKNKIAFELPYNRTSFDLGFGEFSNSRFGNIAVAFQMRNHINKNYFEVKLRVPTNGENNFGPVLLADYTERLTSVYPDIVSLESSYNLESTNDMGMYLRFRPGIKLIIATNDDIFDDSYELLLDLNLLGGYRNENLDINGGITTTSIITEGDEDFDDRVLRQLFTTVTYSVGAFTPGLVLRYGLGDIYGDLYNVVIGVSGTYTFGTKTNQSVESSDSN